MQNLLAVGLGGFLGAIARYTMGGFVDARLNTRFPWGTLAVNVLGCLLIGLLLGLVSGRGQLSISESTRLFLVTGFLGSMTTFSTFGHETIELIQQDNAGESAARNAGIKASTSTWIAQVDADDWWDPRKLELQLQAAVERGVECVLVHTGQITHDRDGHVDASSLKRAGERVGWCMDKLNLIWLH